MTGGESSFARSSAIYLISAALSAAIPFLILPFMTRWLGTADFGRLGTYLSLLGVLSTAVGLSTHGLVSVAYFRDGAEKLAIYAGTAIGIAAFLASCCGILIFFFAGPLETLTQIDRAWLPTLAVAAFGQFVLSVMLAIFQVSEQPARYAALQLSYTSTISLLSLILVGGFGLGIDGRIGAQVCGMLAVMLTVLSWLTLTKRIDWNIRHWRFAEALRFGLPTIPHSLGAIWMVSVDRLALSAKAGAHDAGLYFLGIQIATVLTLLGLAVNQAWLPRLYALLADNGPVAKRQIVQTVYRAIAVTIGLAALIMIAAPWIIDLAGGPEFKGSYPFVLVLVAAYGFNTLYFFVSGFLFYHSRTGLLACVTVAIAFLQTALTFGLIEFFGPMGVAWATLASSFAYFIATWIASNSVHPLPWIKGFKTMSAVDPAT